jgi:hypothetical protein
VPLPCATNSPPPCGFGEFNRAGDDQQGSAIRMGREERRN